MITESDKIISAVPIDRSMVPSKSVLDDSPSPSYTDKSLSILSDKYSIDDTQFSTQVPFNQNGVLCFNKLTVCSTYFFYAKDAKNRHMMMVMLYLMREIHGRMIKQLNNLTDISSSKLSILESMRYLATDFIHQHDKHLDAFMSGKEYSTVPTMAPYKDVVEQYQKILKTNLYEKYQSIAESILYPSSTQPSRPSQSSLHGDFYNNTMSSLFTKSQLGGTQDGSLSGTQDSTIFADIVQLVNEIDDGSKRGTLKLFYAPRCQYSAPVMKVFEAMKLNKYDFDVKMINCDANQSEKYINNIKSYPTIRFYPANNDKYIDFNEMFDENTRTLANMEKFATHCNTN